MARCRTLRSLTKVVGSLVFLAMLLPIVVDGAVITVDGTCSLADAIIAANTDSPTNGCPPGAGDDTLILTGDQSLSEILPAIETTMTVEGDGFTVDGAAAGSSFPVLTVALEDIFTTLTLNNTTLSNGSRGIDFRGIFAGGTYLNNTVVKDNLAEGIRASDYVGFVTLVDSTISGNAIGLDVSYYSGARVYSSTIVGNGIGVQCSLVSCDGLVVLENSTVSGNDVGISLEAPDYGFVLLENSTVADNRIGAYYAGGSNGLLLMRNSVLGHNTESNCSGDPWDDDGGNLDDDGTCGFPSLTGLDPALADNGGPTATHALLAGSTAINAAGDCELTTDQRGFPRDDGACDSGAYEFDGGPPGDDTLVVTGSCPGVITIDVTTTVPERGMLLFISPAQGSSVVPNGVCSGTPLAVDSPRFLGTVRTDANGEGSLSTGVPANRCGAFLQGVERPNCQASNVAPISPP